MTEPLLAPFVRRFLVEHVVKDRNLSLNTQRSYRDTLRLLFQFMAEHNVADPTRIAVSQVTPEVVRSFLDYLEGERGNGTTTRNQRLSAIRSLFSFIAREAPELVDCAAQIRRTPLRRCAPPTLDYLEKDEMDALLAVPDRTRAQGQRDYAMLLFLYNTGARATEAASLTTGALRLDDPPSVRFRGKGAKTRLCPLWSHTVEVLRQLLGPRLSGPDDAPVFLNVRRQPMTRHGIYALVERTVARATEAMPSLRRKTISPHTIRHTTAVHLLRAGVDINTIRAWLGHVSLETTNRYAEVDLEMKAKALQTCAVGVAGDTRGATPLWREDSDLMAFLTSL
ncbi:MAG: site-specific integrase [Chloroflexota bacterium]